MNIFITKTARAESYDAKGNWGHALFWKDTFLLLEIKTTDENDAPKVGESLIHLLQEKITDHPIESLESLKHILHLVESKKSIKTFILGKIINHILYLGLQGEGKAFIKRNGKVVPLIEKEGALSGFVQKNDLFVFTTAAVRKTLSSQDLQSLMERNDITTLEEKLVPYTLGEKAIPGFVAFIVSIQMEKDMTTVIPDEETRKNLFKESKISVPNVQKLKNTISTFIKEKILQKEEGPPPEDAQKRRTKKILITIALLLLSLFAISIGFGINNQFGKLKKEEFKKTIDLLSYKFDEAVSLVDLNPERSRALLKEAKDKANTLLGNLTQNSKEYKNVQEWIKKIENQELIAARIYKLSAPSTLFDLNIIRSKAKGSKLALFEDTIVVLDEEGKRLYTLTTEGKKAEVVAGPDRVLDAKYVSVHGKNAYIANAGGIVRINLETKKASQIIKKDTEIETIGALSAYAGNLYLLDKSKNQIWKYIAQESDFTEKKEYLEEDVKPDFSDAKAISIDGSIWVLSQNSILKFTQGRLDPYDLNSGDEENLKIDAFFTNENTENLYLLDSQKGNVVVYTKEGKYTETYQSPEFKGAEDLLVAENGKKILILNGSNIYSIDIK